MEAPRPGRMGRWAELGMDVVFLLLTAGILSAVLMTTTSNIHQIGMSVRSWPYWLSQYAGWARRLLTGSP